MKALIVVIMGGVGNLLGTLIAGLILGLAEIAVARLVDPGLTLAVNFVDLPRRAALPADGPVRERRRSERRGALAGPADRRRGGARSPRCRSSPTATSSRSASASDVSRCSPRPGRCSRARPATSRSPPSPSSASAPTPWRCSSETLPVPAIIVIAAAIGVAVALLVGLATLRLRGIFFVIFTFGLAELIRQIVTWYEINVTRTVGRYIFLDIGQEQIYWQLLGAHRAGLPRRLADPPLAPRPRAPRHRRRRDRRPPCRHQHHRAPSSSCSRSAPPS